MIFLKIFSKYVLPKKKKKKLKVAGDFLPDKNTSSFDSFTKK